MSFLHLSPTVILARIIVLLTALPVHEAAHAWAAHWMGDDTAYYSNRLTFNPLRHIDPVGAVMILFFGVGFAKPVPVNTMRFRDRTKGIVVTSLAGPVSNILLAWVCMILSKGLMGAYFAFGASRALGASQLFRLIVQINLGLAVFNLLPMPPLDGYHAVMPFLPAKIAWKVQQYERTIVWVILALVWLGALDGILGALMGLLYSLVNGATFFMDILLRAVG